jgi:hypothetical protein
MQYHAMSILQASGRTVRFFGLLESVDGIRPELEDAQFAGRLQFVGVYNMYALCAPFITHMML